MHLYGTKVTQEQIDAVNAAMVGTFTYADCRAAASRAGVEFDTGRLADRLLQKARKAGKVEFIGLGEWRAISTDAEKADATRKDVM